MTETVTKTYSLGGPMFTLFLVFLILKLTETIAWSWWWVTAPLWLPTAFFLGMVAFALLVALTCATIEALTR